MLIEVKNKAKKKAKRQNSIRGTQRFTKPSQTNSTTNIPINSEIAIPKLEKLAQEYIGISNCRVQQPMQSYEKCLKNTFFGV